MSYTHRIVLACSEASSINEFEFKHIFYKVKIDLISLRTWKKIEENLMQ